MESISEIPTQDTIQQNQTLERFILPKSKGIIASTREKARKRQKRNEQSLIPTTSNHLEDTGNKQFASTSNHLEDTENQEQVNQSNLGNPLADSWLEMWMSQQEIPNIPIVQPIITHRFS
ncbi:unnamed protein product [Gordionus sp. m RMFG-2023]